jgi:hypothetical protein
MMRSWYTYEYSLDSVDLLKFDVDIYICFHSGTLMLIQRRKLEHADYIFYEPCRKCNNAG